MRRASKHAISCLALLLVAGTGVSACGGDDGSTGSSTEDAGDMTSSDGGSTGGGDNNNGDAGTGSETDAGDNSGGSSGGAQVKEEFQSEGGQAKCEGSDQPDRCSVTGGQMASFEGWGPASALTDLEVASDKAQSCCYDMDQQEEQDDIDNELSRLLQLFSSQFDADAEIDSAIKEGEFVLVAEHQGLDNLQNDDEFKLNFYLAEYGEEVSGKPGKGTSVAINPASFDKGTQPEAQVAPAQLQDGSIEAGPGQVSLQFNIPQIGELSLDVNGAKVEGNINSSESELEGSGVVIEDGKLGGYVRLRDVVTSINGVLENCGCLNNPDPSSNPVLSIPNENTDDPDLCPSSNPNCDQPIACSTDQESGKEFSTLADNQCSEKEDGQVCTLVSDVCGLNPGQLLKDQTDLDTDGDGYPDAVSIGAVFDMTGATIDGIAPYVAVENQTVGSEVSVGRAFHDQGFWVVIHADDNGSPGQILGKKKFEAGDRQDVSVSLDQALSQSVDGDSAKLWAMLHVDKGEKGTFEFGENDNTDAPVTGGQGDVEQVSFTADVQ